MIRGDGSRGCARAAHPGAATRLQALARKGVAALAAARAAAVAATDGVVRLVERGRRMPLPTFHHPAYRLPLPTLDARTGLEPRRADFAAWYLVEQRVIAAAELRRPRRASYAELALVHDHEYLAALSRPDTLAPIFGVDPADVVVDEVLRTVRLAVGATIEAARLSLGRRGPSLNLLGGFHHAAPAHGGGLCAVNDVAVAIAVLRRDGFGGRVAVLDLDAHPPDGTAACLAGDRASWIGSISGADFGPLPGVDEVALPGAGDDAYLAALRALLGRMPRPALAFVLAGGDVLAGDRLGGLRLSLDGARRRDLAVAARLDGIASVWLPAGGYSSDAWRVLAGTALALARRSRRPVADVDPLAARYAAIARAIVPERLRVGAAGSDDTLLSDDDVAASLRLAAPPEALLLGYYTAEGLEHALARYGLLALLERLGYRDFRVELAVEPAGGDRVRLLARGPAGEPGGAEPGGEHLVVDCALARLAVGGAEVLYVHWLTLRNPRARFGPARARLPGQEVPGLGVSREVSELFERVALRLGLAGVAFRPAHYHTAYAARHRFRFLDPGRQGRFEALMRDLAARPLAEVTCALADGRVRIDGARYLWEPELMVEGLGTDSPEARAAAAAERERVHFTLDGDEARA